MEGVDALFFGADDLALGRGLPMDKPRPNGYFDQALKTVADSAKASGKIPGGIFTSPEALLNAVKLGYRLIGAAADVSFLANGSRAAVQLLRQCLTTTENKDNNTTKKVKSV